VVREGSIFELGDASSGGVSKPYGAIGSDRHSAQPHDRAVERKLRHLAGEADVHNRAGLYVGVPGASIGGDRQSERLVISPRRRQQLDAAVANSADGIGLIDGEPDGAIGRGRNRHGSIVWTRHAVLDEARQRRRTTPP